MFDDEKELSWIGFPTSRWKISTANSDYSVSPEYRTPLQVYTLYIIYCRSIRIIYVYMNFVVQTNDIIIIIIEIVA